METERKSELRAVSSFVIALGILASAAFGAILLVTNARKAKQVETPRAIATVLTFTARKGTHAVTLESQGVVESRRETKLASEVAGRVTEISPNLKRGGIVAEGEVLLQIDAADYRAALARAGAARADAELALVQEEARAAQAKRDWEQLGRGEATPLVLREPQLASIRAALESAEAEVERAARDVERSTVRAPFAARVRQAPVEVGVVLAPGGLVAELYSAEDLEVRMPLSLEDFGFLGDESRTGIKLRGSIGGEELEWPAEVARIDGEVDRRTLSAYVTLKVLPSDGARRFPPVGLFVRAEVKGKVLSDVTEIPRTALRGEDEVILVDADQRLDFRRVEVVRSTGRTLIVSKGIEDGDRLCLTRLNAPVKGMEVLVEEPAEPAAD
jgi:RND family efflux transporter MFP subunit